MTQTLIKPVKGTRDFYPESWEFQKWLSQKWLSLGASFGYQEYEAPILEPIELYLEKSSQEIVKEQTFSLKDRNDETLILRPELTPSLARMVAQKENELVFPVRWQSYGRFWRYEKPQRGRGREFFQWNIDILGIDTPQADAEILTLACNTLKTLGVTPSQTKVKINDREALEKLILDTLKVNSDQARTALRCIDRIDKLSSDDFNAWLLDLGFTQDQVGKLLDIINSTDSSFSPRLQSILQFVPAEIEDYLEIDRRVVRGFEYYTNLVFEAWANTSLKRALFGGGRYNNLTLQVGGQKQIPGVGFAVGDMPMLELLSELNLEPSLPASPSLILVTVFSPDCYSDSLKLVQYLRSQGINSEIIADPSVKFGNQIKYADKKGIPYVAILGEDEIKANKITLKNLSTGDQESLTQSELISHLL